MKNIIVTENINELAEKCAKYIVKLAKKYIKKNDLFTIALSGGSTPKYVYETLLENYSGKVNWSKVYFFFGDDRYVPYNHENSNFLMAYESFLKYIDISDNNIMKIPVKSKAAVMDAKIHENELKAFFYNTGNIKNTFPVFDLILNGIGTDGHTASLFPEDKKSLEEKERWVINTKPKKMKPNVDRITFTFPVLNNTDNAVFIVSGKNKKNIINTIFNDPEKAKKIYPAARINPRGNLKWFIEKNAISE